MSVHRPPRPGKVVCANVKHVDCMYVCGSILIKYVYIHIQIICHLDRHPNKGRRIIYINIHITL